MDERYITITGMLNWSLQESCITDADDQSLLIKMVKEEEVEKESLRLR